MKKFLDITGLKTLVDWIKSKFNSVEKAQYVANRNFKKYTRKKEKEIYILGKAMKQSPIGQTCWYYTGSYPCKRIIDGYNRIKHHHDFNINLVRLFMNQFTPPPHKVNDTNINLLLEGFYYNITFYNFNNEIEHNVSGFFKVKESEYDIENQSLVLEQFEKIDLEFYDYFNFSYIPSDSITTGETNGHKSIYFSVYTKAHTPNENDIVKSNTYKLEYSNFKGAFVKKIKYPPMTIGYNNGYRFEYGTTYNDLLCDKSYVFDRFYLMKRGTTRRRNVAMRKGPKFSNVRDLAKIAEPGYYQLWYIYGKIFTYCRDFVITTATWDFSDKSKLKPKTLMVIYP